MRSWSILLFLASVLTLGCSAAPDEEGSSPPSPPTKRRDEWMVGSYSWSGEWAGDLLRSDIHLEPDGTGSDFSMTIRPNISYGLGNETSTDPIRSWWSDDHTLFIDDARHDLVMTPNCRLVKFDGRVYSHWPNGACPKQPAPLTDREAKMVGNWSFFEEREYSNRLLLIRIEADRNVDYRMTIGGESFKHTSYFTVDADGVFHGNNIDGGEDFQLTLEPTTDGLSWCEYRDRCYPLTRER